LRPLVGREDDSASIDRIRDWNEDTFADLITGVILQVIGL